MRNKTHFASDYGSAVCMGGRVLNITTNPSEVTCKKCLSIIRTRALFDKEKTSA